MISALIVGAGRIGGSIAFRLLEKGVQEVWLVGRDLRRMEGVCADLTEAFPNSSIRLAASDEDLRNVDTSFFCFSTLSWSPSIGFNDREIEAMDNLRIVNELRTRFARTSFGNLFVISNPIDLITRFVSEVFGYEKVFGIGSALDGRRCDLAIRSMFPSVSKPVRCVGEHGEHLVPLLSEVSSQPFGLTDYKRVRAEAFRHASTIIRNTSIPFYGPLAACFELIDQLLSGDSGSIVLSSVLDRDFLGVASGVALGVPVLLEGGQVRPHYDLLVSDLEAELFSEAGVACRALYERLAPSVTNA